MNDDFITIPPGQFSEVINGLPNDRGICIDSWLSEHFCKAISVTPSVLEEWNKDRSKFHVICMATRPIMQRFCEYLEHTYFPPSTSMNDELKLTYYRWQDLIFSIATVPIGRIDWCFESAKKLDMRLADGVPHIISNDGLANHLGAVRNRENRPVVAKFPLDTDQAYVLEPEHHVEGPVIGAVAGITPAPVYKHERTYVDDIMEKMRDARRKK